MKCESEDYTICCGSLGAISKQFGNRLKEIGITAKIGQVQKTVLLGTARILRKVLEIYGCGLILREFSSIVLLCASSIIISFKSVIPYQRNDCRKRETFYAL